jgi:hypothetical protein
VVVVLDGACTDGGGYFSKGSFAAHVPGTVQRFVHAGGKETTDAPQQNEQHQKGGDEAATVGRGKKPQSGEGDGGEGHPKALNATANHHRKQQGPRWTDGREKGEYKWKKKTKETRQEKRTLAV